MRRSLCLETVLTDISFYDRIHVAKSMGFDAVEFWDAFHYDPVRISREVEKADIPVIGCILKRGPVAGQGMNVSSDVLVRYLKDTLEYGKTFGCRTFYALAGDAGADSEMQKAILIENLKRCAEVLEKGGETLLLEPVNSLVDHKGCFLDSSHLGFEIIKAVDSPHIKLLYDVYHMQIMEGNIIQTMTENVEYIGHIHVAGVPGRHEPQWGEINYKNVIYEVERAGYSGYWGLEYWPSVEHRMSLKSVLEYLL